MDQLVLILYILLFFIEIYIIFRLFFSLFLCIFLFTCVLKWLLFDFGLVNIQFTFLLFFKKNGSN